MMNISYEQLNCTTLNCKGYMDKKYKLVRCVLKNTTKTIEELKARAWNLAQTVNPHSANNSISIRDKDRQIKDALGGVIAEYGWYYYIQQAFGNIVSFTDFTSASSQVDLLLSNGKIIEIRSSFPRNGIGFALCHQDYVFKSLGKYTNLYKLDEIEKDFFAAVLFETQKNNLLIDKEIVFYLIGGSTQEMMKNDNIAYDDNLVAEDDLTQTKTKYRVIKLCNALDINGFEQYMQQIGYNKILNF